MHEYGSNNWEKLWEKLEQEGNVGLDYVINPYLYPLIAEYINKHPKSLVIDFGCGTNVMGIQLLFGYTQSVPALKDLDSIDQARFNTLLYLGLEGSEELVNQSNKYLQDIGGPKNIATKHIHIGQSMDGVFDTQSIDLCVSRNFLMHLSAEDLESHFLNVSDILKKDGQYIFATLNPEYELSKAGRKLENGEKYEFSHGKSGEYGTFYHYYKELSFYEEIIKRNFTIISKTLCSPIADSFKDSHQRYYNADVPMALVYALEKVNK